MAPPIFDTTIPGSTTGKPAYQPDVFGLVILECVKERHRVAETGLLEHGKKSTFGRGRPGLVGTMRFGPHRPGGPPIIAPLEWCVLDGRVSRDQLQLEPTATGINMLVTGDRPTFVNGERVPKGEGIKLDVDDVGCVEGCFLFLVVRRQRIMQSLQYVTELPPFGTCWRGRVGEGPKRWELEDELALAASRHHHVMLFGETGTGKEAAASTIHDCSPRAKGTYKPINTAAIDKGLFASDVFGCIANVVGPGMPAREGHLAAAEGGTLFLDEIGGTTVEDQTKLLRAVENGQYSRVGESRNRQHNVAIVAATSAIETDLKLDFRKRFPRTIQLKPLRLQKEDIPLLLRHTIMVEAAKYPEEMARFLEQGPDGKMYPRVRLEFIEALVHHPLPGNVRDVQAFVVKALFESRGDWIELPSTLDAEAHRPARKLPVPSTPPTPPPVSGPRKKSTKEEVSVALEKTDSVRAAAMMLGVPRRTLRNWMEEYGLDPKDS